MGRVVAEPGRAGGAVGYGNILLAHRIWVFAFELGFPYSSAGCRVEQSKGKPCPYILFYVYWEIYTMPNSHLASSVIISVYQGGSKVISTLQALTFSTCPTRISTSEMTSPAMGQPIEVSVMVTPTM